MNRVITAAIFLCAGCAAKTADIPTVAAVVETPPVATDDDAADDPAIWINPADAGASLVLGTDKGAGLNVYRLDGSLLQFLEFGELNNVDLRRKVSLGGWSGDLAAASNRKDNTIALFSIDAAGARHVGSFRSPFEEPYGLCMGVIDGAVVIAVTYKTGDIVLYRPTGRAAAEETQRLKLPSQLEGCVFDDANKTLFIGEEAKGIWKAVYAGGAYGEPTMIAETGGETGMTPDVEGLALYQTADGGGWILASSQGNNSYAVFDRSPPHRLAGRFAIVPRGTIDGAEETDGVDATSAALGSAFPKGILVVQDGFNDPKGSAQNFKVVDWRDIETALGLAE